MKNSGSEYIRKKIWNKKGNVIFIHGFNSTWRHHQPLLDRLYDDGYNVYSFDLPNHGENLRYDRQFTFDEYCRYVIDWIKQHRITKNLIIIGHSMGGGINSAIASSIKNVKNIVLISPFQRGVKAHAVSRTLSLVFTGTGHHKMHEFIKPKNPTFNGVTLLNDIISSSVLDTIDRGLANIDTSTFLIFGTQDEVIPADPSIEHIKSKVHSQFLEVSTVQDSGHSPFIDNFHTSYSLIINFLNKNQ
ncbi:MAG: alpha/beta hydrolase [Mycoplasmataceae bacterium]|nr:alpha/beta hydrolase [Mycoplasmataceae bacterium]